MQFTDPRYFLYRHVQDYHPADPAEKESRTKVLRLLETCPRPFERSSFPGHIVGSALVVDEEFTSTLLNHHAKINRWQQFGGHPDGDNNLFSVGLREASEESGLKSIHWHYPYTGIFDLDVHEIPARKDEPMHWHYDIRIILVADIQEPFLVTKESKALQWIKFEDVPAYNQHPVFLRMIHKAENLKRDFPRWKSPSSAIQTY